MNEFVSSSFWGNELAVRPILGGGEALGGEVRVEDEGVERVARRPEGDLPLLLDALPFIFDLLDLIFHFFELRLGVLQFFLVARFLGLV